MKRVWMITVVAALGLSVSACKDKKDDSGEVSDEAASAKAGTPTDTEEPTAEDEAEALEDEETVAAEEETADVINEPLFLKAYFEATCVQAQIEDPEEQTAILEEVYARYGFDEESFKAARKAKAQEAHIKMALDTRMEKCTPELAKSFEEAGSVATADGDMGVEATDAGETDAGEDAADAGSEEAAKEEKKPKKPTRRYKTGAYADRGMRVGDISQGEMLLTFSDKGTVSGYFKGKREGKAFNLPFKGSVSNDGSFRIRGNLGQNSISGSGGASKTRAVGVINGKINGKGYKIRFSAGR